LQEARAMRATVTIDYDLLEKLVSETGHKNKASAVREAIAVYLKQKNIEKIRLKKGKVRFDRTADEIRHYER
jgi:hypothetical protein